MLPNIQNIAQYTNDQEFLRQAYFQIQKDTSRTGIELTEPFDSEWTITNLIDYLKPIVNRLFECNSEKIFALFYTIDIPEKAIRAALNNNSPFGVSHEVTKLIIERELLKVLTKAYFRDQLK